MWSSTAVIGRHRWLQELPYDVSTVWIPPGHTPWHPTIVGALTAVLSMACSGPSTLPADGTVDNSADVRHDLHSYSNPSQARVRHLDLELEVSFDERILRGTATLTVERVQPDADTIILDTRDLTIRRVETSAPNDDAWPATFHQGSSDPVLGTPLTVFLPPVMAPMAAPATAPMPAPVAVPRSRSPMLSQPASQVADTASSATVARRRDGPREGDDAGVPEGVDKEDRQRGVERGMGAPFMGWFRMSTPRAWGPMTLATRLHNQAAA